MGCVSFLGKLGQNFFSIPALIFWRYTLSFIASFVVVCLIQKRRKILDGLFSKKLQFFRVVCVLVSQYSFFYYMSVNSLLNATLLLNTGPLFIPLIDKWILKKHVGVSTWVSVLIAFIGVLFILPPEKDLFTWQSGIGLLAGFAQGTAQVLFGLHVGEEKKSLDMFSFYLFASFLALTPYLFFPTMVGKELLLGWEPYVIIALLAGASGMNQYFRALAFQISTPGRLSSFLYVSIVVAGLWDWLVFNNVPTLGVFIGAFLILLGGILKIYLRGRILRKKDQDSDLMP